MSPIPVNQTVSVTTSLAVIGTPLVLNGVARDVSLEIKNTGAAALTGFKIQRQFTDNGDWVDWIANTDFSTATAKCNASGGTSGNKVYALAAPAHTAWIDFDPGAAVAVQFPRLRRLRDHPASSPAASASGTPGVTHAKICPSVLYAAQSDIEDMLLPASPTSPILVAARSPPSRRNTADIPPASVARAGLSPTP